MQSIQPTSVPDENETRVPRFRKHASGGIVAYVDPLYLESLQDLGLFEPGGLERAVAFDAATDKGRRARGPPAQITTIRAHSGLFSNNLSGGYCLASSPPSRPATASSCSSRLAIFT